MKRVGSTDEMVGLCSTAAGSFLEPDSDGADCPVARLLSV